LIITGLFGCALTSPKGYATQIGNYLYSLPQALEPFSKSHNLRKDEYAASMGGADNKKILSSNIEEDELSLQGLYLDSQSSDHLVDFHQ